MTIGLVGKAPKDGCTVSLTPRRLQKLKPEAARSSAGPTHPSDRTRRSSRAKLWPMMSRLLTIPQLTVTKGKNRIAIRKE